MTQMRPTKRTDWINGWWEGRKANLFTRSLKYKLQEDRTFWWTSNSLPSTIIFRSVNSFSLRCWFNSFNISVEQRRNRQCQTRVQISAFFGTDATTKAENGKYHHSGIDQKFKTLHRHIRSKINNAHQTSSRNYSDQKMQTFTALERIKIPRHELARNFLTWASISVHNTGKIKNTFPAQTFDVLLYSSGDSGFVNNTVENCIKHKASGNDDYCVSKT